MLAETQLETSPGTFIAMDGGGEGDARKMRQRRLEQRGGDGGRFIDEQARQRPLQAGEAGGGDGVRCQETQLARNLRSISCPPALRGGRCRHAKPKGIALAAPPWQKRCQTREDRGHRRRPWRRQPDTFPRCQTACRGDAQRGTLAAATIGTDHHRLVRAERRQRGHHLSLIRRQAIRVRDLTDAGRCLPGGWQRR